MRVNSVKQERFFPCIKASRFSWQLRQFYTTKIDGRRLPFCRFACYNFVQAQADIENLRLLLKVFANNLAQRASDGPRITGEQRLRRNEMFRMSMLQSLLPVWSL